MWRVRCIKKKIKEIKDNNILIRIKDDIKNCKEINILGQYQENQVEQLYIEAISLINRIDFPITFTKKVYDKKEDYIKCIYDFLKIDISSCIWLIPYYKGSSWWMELQIADILKFINMYFSNYELNDFAVFDKTNNFLIDISNGEKNFEYRILKYGENGVSQKNDNPKY